MFGKKMKVNMTKCFYLTFTVKGATPDYTEEFDYMLLGESIQRQRCMKYLGVMISDDFYLEEHYNYLQKRPSIVNLRRRVKALGWYPGLKMSYFNKQVRRKLEKDCCAWSMPLLDKNKTHIIEMENFQDSFFGNIVPNNVQALAERRLAYVLELIFKIISNQRSYQILVKTLDICEKEFNGFVFAQYFQSDDSIIGNGLKEFVRLRDFVALKDQSIEFHVFAKQPKSSREKLMGEFCAKRYKDYIENGEDKTLVKPLDALACISKCFHPNLSTNKLQTKLQSFAESENDRAHLISAVITAVKSIISECSEDDKERIMHFQNFR